MSDACCGPRNDVEPDAGPERLWQIRELQFAALAAVLLAVSWIAGRVGYEGIAHAVELAAVAAGAITFVPDAVRNLRHGRIGVGTLMTIAAIGAVALGQFAEAALLGILFSIAEGLEHYAVSRTRRGLRSLLSLVPPKASVLRDGIETTVAPQDLVIGDVMVIRPGERAATDGTIRAGQTSLDLSAITGESVPVEAGPGSDVFAGAINGGGAIEVEVTAPAADSSLARIVHIVEQAQERKGAGQRMADRIARPLVPAIMALAAVIAAVGAVLGDPMLWLERALVVLVAASPCALAIAVPLTVVAAIGAATRHGALIKGGAAVEELGRITVVALDKTGTLTRNQPRVVEVITTDDLSDADALRWAAALEMRSEHPLAQAILTAAGDSPAASDVTALAGHGLHGDLDGHRLRLGKPSWVAPGPLAADVERLQAAGATVVVLARDDQPVAAIAVRDELRPEAAEAVRLLKRMGITVAMLTGDNTRTADTVAADAGITTVHSELLPEDKAALLPTLSTGRPIAMVGDGINDAPALATADIGIAMGAMGTDVAIETADVALMGEDLRHLPQVLAHSRHARRIMVQNIAFSLAIIAVLIPLAAFGVLGLATVVLIHETTEIFVILNAIRSARITALPGVTATTPRTTTHTLDIGPAPVLDDPCCSPLQSAQTPATSISLSLITPAPAQDEHGCDCCAPTASPPAVNGTTAPTKRTSRR
ncbi:MULTISPECIES: heavy metal translocating P-type ATPase [Mycobacteriaceae]|uniref:P-type Cu(+) transporter n=2 Tax=Mycolicibacterium TaxID=1866885 RepID=A0A178LZZ3_MYCIR|nr:MULTISPECIES: cation-translocating P-type ATPase [Mycobacteriaceae]MBU8830168.1 cadmium-translocating P-type ATPase [Mycolicibacterium goodii]MCG7595655.1 cadmium-translocating P-type ATPase [Mycobacterium sp. PSTR-4-N]MDZ5086296.1 cation-translocating P-type ATPase [Mycolicibacterium parafortuitum]OAN40351.1 cadmium-transporting ATPase [Mycolicibacterium iranicum]QVI29462.1 cadmium-translocating P-type ATPase [Mycolicibacterium neoaurum]